MSGMFRLINSIIIKSACNDFGPDGKCKRNRKFIFKKSRVLRFIGREVPGRKKKLNASFQMGGRKVTR